MNEQRFRLVDRFNRIATRITDAVGSPAALAASVLLVIGWAISGPLFNFSDTWQLFINTTTTVITFWMVFVIQNAANRDAKALHLKLDEIIRATSGARNELITLEQAPEAVVAQTAEELAAIAQQETGDGMAAVTVTGELDGRTERATATAASTSRNGTTTKRGAAASGAGTTRNGAVGTKGGSSTSSSSTSRRRRPRSGGTKAG